MATTPASGHSAAGHDETAAGIDVHDIIAVVTVDRAAFKAEDSIVGQSFDNILMITAQDGAAACFR